MTLDEFFVEKAKNELRETESRKRQSLQQFRELLQKHPFLKGVRQDDIHLLQFLRAKKYNINHAIQIFEAYYLARKNYPKFVPDDIPNLSLEFFIPLIRKGHIYPLPGRDFDGCRVVLIQTRRLDMDEYTIFDGVKFGLFVLGIILEEEETQIAGIKMIFDHQDMTTKHIMFPKDALDFADMIKTVTAARPKGMFIINLPTIAHISVELVRNVLTEKLKSRLFLHRTWDDLIESGKFDTRMLPKELGGLKPEAEIIDEFEKLAIQKWDALYEMLVKSNIDYTKVPSSKFRSSELDEGVGSFRKLEID